MNTITTKQLEKKYSMCHKSIVKILAGMDYQTGPYQEKQWPHDQATAAIEKHIANNTCLKTRPDLSVYCYPDSMVKLFKAGKSTVRKWLEHKDFPKPIGHFSTMPRYKTPYFLITAVDAFQQQLRSIDSDKPSFKPDDKNLLNSTEANHFLNLPEKYLIKYWKHIPGMPKPEKISRFFFWHKDQLTAWTESLGDKTPHDLFLDYAKQDRNNTHSTEQATLSRAFLSGQFATPEQQLHFKTKREHARRHPPKVTRVVIAAEW